jgi:hypothetical protein
MKNRVVWTVLAVMAAVIALVLTGCATGQYAGTTSQSDLLTQAGFIKRTESSPERLAAIHTLPAKKVVSNEYKGKVLYLVCTDPSGNKCFLGDRAAYDKYQELAIQQSITEDQRKVMEHRSDPQFWQMWMDSQGGG